MWENSLVIKVLVVKESLLPNSERPESLTLIAPDSTADQLFLLIYWAFRRYMLRLNAVSICPCIKPMSKRSRIVETAVICQQSFIGEAGSLGW